MNEPQHERVAMGEKITNLCYKLLGWEAKSVILMTKVILISQLCQFNQAPFLFADYVPPRHLSSRYTMNLYDILPKISIDHNYEEISRHFKNLYFKVCQIPFVDGQNDHQTTVVKFIRDYANDNNPRNRYDRTPLHIAAQDGDQLTVLLILKHAKVGIQLPTRFSTPK
jgi:hypothetical protein